MRPSTTWRGFRSILCAVDFSEHSALALQYAAVLARRVAGSLTALHVVDPLLAAAASAALHDRELMARSERELRRFADAYLTEAAGVAVARSERVRLGPPADEILAAAADADLIVMGTAGLTGPRRMIMGSTTFSVLQRSTVPVLAVPPVGAAASPPSSEWPGRLVVAAVDADEHTRAELQAAADVAASFRAKLLIVHVVAAVSGTDAAAAIDVNRLVSQLDAEAGRLRSDVAARVRVASGDVGPEIAAAATSEGSGLVVTVRRARHGWFGPQRGSVSYDAVAHAAVPVLALPPQSA